MEASDNCIDNAALEKRKSAYFTSFRIKDPTQRNEQSKYLEDSILSRISNETLVGHEINILVGDATLIKDIK